jgi:hypothetical protein
VVLLQPVPQLLSLAILFLSSFPLLALHLISFPLVLVKVEGVGQEWVFGFVGIEKWLVIGAAAEFLSLLVVSVL